MLSDRTSHRVAFIATFFTVFVLYVGGITCFVASSQIQDPAISYGLSRVKTSIALLFAWATYVLGPFATVTFHVGWQLDYGLMEREHEFKYFEAGRTAMSLLILHFCSQLVFTIVIIIITLKLRAASSCLRSCGWCCVAVCCPTCALVSAVASTKRN